jgi:hypothetical protein
MINAIKNLDIPVVPSDEDDNVPLTAISRGKMILVCHLDGANNKYEQPQPAM